MATFTTKRIVDALIATNGYSEGDPRVAEIVEFTTRYGFVNWGVTWVTEPPTARFRYRIPTDDVRNPRVIWPAPAKAS